MKVTALLLVLTFLLLPNNYRVNRQQLPSLFKATQTQTDELLKLEAQFKQIDE